MTHWAYALVLMSPMVLAEDNIVMKVELGAMKRPFQKVDLL